MAKYFGTDGFRGEANRELTALHAYRIGRFLGAFYAQDDRRARVVIGKDTRASSYMLEAALCAGLTSAGADAYLLHVSPTPSVAYVARSEGFDCGVMISASHNPYWDNGLKLINAQGEKMQEDVLARAEAFIDGPDTAPLAVREGIGRVVDHAAGRNRYMGYLIALAEHSYRGMRVGLDCANGAVWQLAEHVFKALGAQVVMMGNTPTGENINVGCGSTHIEQLRQLVCDRQLDVGFAFDGDADRCIAVDERGDVVDGDRILYLCAAYMHSRGLLQGHVVATVMSNMGLPRALARLGIGCEQTDVGDRQVYECMCRRGDLLGGEQSGHIIFSRYATTGDGVLTAIRVMEAMLGQKRKLSELHADMVSYPQIQRSLRMQRRDAALAHPGILAALEDIRRGLGDQGRILLRKSGTEPVLRIMCEALRADAAQRAVQGMLRALRDNGFTQEE